MSHSRVFGLVPNINLIIGTSVATALAVIAVARLTSQSNAPKRIPSPRETLLPKLSKEEQAALAYPPDLFPGARDVPSPVRPHPLDVHISDIHSTVQSASTNGAPHQGEKCCSCMGSARHAPPSAGSPTVWSRKAAASCSLIYGAGGTATPWTSRTIRGCSARRSYSRSRRRRCHGHRTVSVSSVIRSVVASVWISRCSFPTW